MKIITKILLPIALIALIAAAVLYCIDLGDLGILFAGKANQLVAWWTDKDNYLWMLGYAGINILLAIVYAIRRRKNKTNINIVLLALDLFLGLLVLVFKDSFKAKFDNFSELGVLSKVAII